VLPPCWFIVYFVAFVRRHRRQCRRRHTFTRRGVKTTTQNRVTCRVTDDVVRSLSLFLVGEEKSEDNQRVRVCVCVVESGKRRSPIIGAAKKRKKMDRPTPPPKVFPLCWPGNIEDTQDRWLTHTHTHTHSRQRTPRESKATRSSPWIKGIAHPSGSPPPFFIYSPRTYCIVLQDGKMV
jgi:hypothetical protein